MNASKLLIVCVLVPFVAYSGWALANGGGLAEVLAALGANPWGLQVTLDLCIALTLVCIWIWRDARARGRSALPWLVLTVCVGSIAPLVYLLLRPADAPGAAS